MVATGSDDEAVAELPRVTVPLAVLLLLLLVKAAKLVDEGAVWLASTVVMVLAAAGALALGVDVVV